MSSQNQSIRLPPLKDAIDRFPLTVTPETLLTDVLVLMSKVRDTNTNLPLSSSCVLVVEEERLVGIFTERDLLKLSVEGRNFAAVTIAEVMTQEVISLTQTDHQDISEALSLMHQHQIRHLPIVNAQGQQLGIITESSILQVLEPSIDLQTTGLQQALFLEKEQTQVTLQSISDAVIITDSLGNIKYLNPVAEKLTDWKLTQAKGLPLNNVFQIINEHTREPVENPVEKVLREGCQINCNNNTILIARDRTQYTIVTSAAPICDRNCQITGAVLVFHDITQSRCLAHQLSWQATHDALTGLVNRQEFEQQLHGAIATAKNNNQQHTLCYLDLDQFKIINDTCGHLAGDELLRQVATLLKGQIRATDTLARLGGDEFGILLTQCPLKRAGRVADTIQKSFQEFRFIWENKVYTIGASLSLVPINQTTHDLAELFGAADAACYAAKDKGRNRIHIYRANDSELKQQRGERQWIYKITQAIEENRFCLYRQKIAPITESALLEGEHYEVLLRLLDEKGTIVPPMAFIPAAERYGLMPAIDRWVISTFFSHYKHLYQQQKNTQRLLYTINISGASVNDDQFLRFLKEQFVQHSVPALTICFEITETVAIANMNKAVEFVSELKQLGCYFSLDDFGSGMSSFTYLKNLPVDYLKIDGHFVENMISDPINLAMVNSINQIGHVMGIQTIAEFVENQTIFEQLRLLGVDYAQGYGIARPCPFLFS